MRLSIYISNTIILLILITLLAFVTSCNNESDLKYKNPNLPIEERVDDLLSRMTLEEKVRQMDMYNGSLMLNDSKDFSVDSALNEIGALGAGVVHDIFPKNAKVANALQRFAVEKTRLGIPFLVVEETLHGYAGENCTVFPQAIGLASTWDKNLITQVGRVIGKEASSVGVHMGLSPVLGIVRDPRWGRTEETYGEDTYLSSEIGLAMVKGMQGSDLKNKQGIIAEPKHFAVHSVPESGSNISPVHFGERDMREYFLEVFRKAFVEGGALSTMSAYSEIDGIPCSANPWLLKSTLREEWGFKGFVLSDCEAINFIQRFHKTADTPKEAIRQAISSGVDMQFYDYSHELFQTSLIELVNDGEIAIEAINRAVGSVLYVKFTLGLFEDPYIEEHKWQAIHNSKENKEIALDAARKSICLLKNDDHLLPLNKDIKTIAVIGPNAAIARFGDYTANGAKGVSVLEGLQKELPSSVKILHDEGCDITALGQAIPAKAFFTSNGKKGIKAEYFSNKDLENEPFTTRRDEQVNFRWEGLAPIEGMPRDEFSVRWTGTIVPEKDVEGWIGFIADDAARLWINDVLVIDKWDKLAPMEKTPIRYKKGKAINFRFEFKDMVEEATVSLRWNLGENNFASAISKAKQADVVVLALGESELVSGENRDRSEISLTGNQEALLKAIHSTGTPIVLVLVNGRPLLINWAKENIPAIVECWFPGESGGIAVAEVLTGKYNPAGRLPITFPKSMGQIPRHYNRKPSSNRPYASSNTYVDMDSEPLFHFGHGLSYTSFEYSSLEMPETAQTDDNVTVSVKVKNTGEMHGEEVVQLYLNDIISSVTTSKIMLKAFERVYIKAGEEKTVTFKLKSDDFALWNSEMERVVEPGEFEIMIGASSNDIRLRQILNVEL